MNNAELKIKLQEIVKNNKPQSITVDGDRLGSWVPPNKKLYISKEKIEKLKELRQVKEGGFLPLLTLLPLIFAGVGAASGVATGVYSAVKSGQESNSKMALDKENMEKIELEKQKLKNELSSKKEIGQGSQSNSSTEYNSIGKGISKAASGIYLDSYQGKAITKYLKNISADKTLRDCVKKLGKNNIEIEIDGDGIYLKPFKNS